MWSAIQTDLLDFVNTVQKDTVEIVTAVLGDEDDEVSIIYALK